MKIKNPVRESSGVFYCLAQFPVGASLLAMEANDDAPFQDKRSAAEIIASRLAPTGVVGNNPYSKPVSKPAAFSFAPEHPIWRTRLIGTRFDSAPDRHSTKGRNRL
ncbi:hypothetical protein EI969_26860 [Pseudomonas sp. PB101]|nr:hypothetical protein [Pseudomonas sp. PB101]